MLIVCCPNMHVTSMDPVDHRRAENLVMHASIRRECRYKMEADGLVPKHTGGRVRLADADDEPQPHVEQNTIRWTWSIRWRMILTRMWVMLRLGRMRMMSNSSGGGGSVCQSLSLILLMTILVAHMTLPC